MFAHGLDDIHTYNHSTESQHFGAETKMLMYVHAYNGYLPGSPFHPHNNEPEYKAIVSSLLQTKLLYRESKICVKIILPPYGDRVKSE